MNKVTISKIMTGLDSLVYFIKADDNLKTAAEKMLKQKVSALPVIGDKTEIIGLLTSKDILRAYVSHENAPNVSTVMSKECIMVKKSDSIQYVSNLMNKLSVHHMIVEHKGLICGIVSSYDFLKLSEFNVNIDIGEESLHHEN